MLLEPKRRRCGLRCSKGPNARGVREGASEELGRDGSRVVDAFLPGAADARSGEDGG